MCEKNLEGKVLSPPSDGDIDETLPKDWKPVKKTKTKKRSKPKKKICGTRGGDILENEIRDMYRFQNSYHQLSVKDYCEEHELDYHDHKCKPRWCGDCGYLSGYEIVVKKHDK